MSDEKNAKKNEASLEEGENKPMERRSFLKMIGIAGGAALAHFFMLGKPSTAFGGQDIQIADGGDIMIRSRCRPTTDGDKGDRCFMNEVPRELGDQCFIRQTSQGPKEVGDECQLTMKLGGPIKEVGDKCTPNRGRRNDEMEIGDECEVFLDPPP